MALTGVNGATPSELPQNNGINAQTEHEQANSVWAEFKENGNNKVDVNDVNYTSNKSDPWIANFLRKHAGETWTDALKSEVNALIDKFNDSCARFSKLDNASTEMEEFTNQAQDKFRAFSKASADDFDATKAQNEQEMAEFTEDANGKVANFTAENVKKKGDFVKESVNKILTDLKDGASGAVVLQGLGNITYDKEKQAIVFNQAGKNEPRVLDNETLEKLLDFAISKDVAISGNSKKITNE